MCALALNFQVGLRVSLLEPTPLSEMAYVEEFCDAAEYAVQNR